VPTTTQQNQRRGELEHPENVLGVTFISNDSPTRQRPPPSGFVLTGDPGLCRDKPIASLTADLVHTAVRPDTLLGRKSRCLCGWAWFYGGLRRIAACRSVFSMVLPEIFKRLCRRIGRHHVTDGSADKICGLKVNAAITA
jgi:hypothetical protein